MISFSK